MNKVHRADRMAGRYHVGAVVTPLLVPWLTITYGWRKAFIVTGIFGVLWLAAWLIIYRHPAEHKSVTVEELAYIQRDPADPIVPIGWRRLLTVRECWAYALGNSSSIRSGGSFCSGCPAIWATATGWTCSALARRWSPRM